MGQVDERARIPIIRALAIEKYRLLKGLALALRFLRGLFADD
jgi:hypothetical protein